MDHDHITTLKGFYPAIWHDSAAVLPDGWAAIIAEFLGDVADIGDLLDAVSCRYERTSSGLKAFCFPEMVKWTEQQLTALHEAQRMLYQLSQQTCERCGEPGCPVEIGKGSFFFCTDHADNARQKLTAKIEAFEERISWRKQMSSLFPHIDVMPLHVSAHNSPILRKALLDIKRIAEERDLVGKILITKVMESEGQLFISARCDAVDVATQFEIQDIVNHAEWESDQASLAANREASDDA